jgi:ATP-dependent DNA helicase PIF1
MIDLLNLLAQQARGNKKPMGGIQVILTGDFFQLPPILKNNTGSFQLKASQPEFLSQSQQNIPELSQSQSQLPTKDTPDRFCFQSPIWNSIIKKSFVLKKVFRQSNNKFICMLDHIREGNLTDDVLESFNECVGREFDADDQILPTQILTHRYDVDKLNEEQLLKLEGELQEYKASDTGDNIYMKMLQNHCPAKSLLKLKIGAQVILVKTIGASDGLMNGSRGIIVKFTNDKKPVVKFCDGNERVINYSSFHFVQGGKVVAQRSQIPLDLAWGISVHKSQGMTVDRAMVNLKKVFEYGQAYVALSRVRSLEGLHLASSLTANQIKVHPAVIDFYRNIETAKEKI